MFDVHPLYRLKTNIFECASRITQPARVQNPLYFLLSVYLPRAEEKPTQNSQSYFNIVNTPEWNTGGCSAEILSVGRFVYPFKTSLHAFTHNSHSKRNLINAIANSAIRNKRFNGPTQTLKDVNKFCTRVGNQRKSLDKLLYRTQWILKRDTFSVRNRFASRSCWGKWTDYLTPNETSKLYY